MCLWYWYASSLIVAIVTFPVYSTPHNNDISVKYSDNYTDFSRIWSGDTSLYEVTEEAGSVFLRQIEGSPTGSNSVCRTSDVAFGQWDFSVSFDGFQTSNQNYAAIWIQRASFESTHGVLVRIGENGSAKRIRLLASDPTGSTTEILASDTPLPADLATVHVRLTRTPTSRWTLQYRFNTSGPWHTDQVTHPVDLHAQSLFCLTTRFTPTRANKFSFGAITTSTQTTFLAHYTTPAPDQLHLHFSKLLPQNTGTTASVQIDGYTGSVSASSHLNTLRLRLSPAPGGGSRRLVVTNLHDYETTLSPITITAQIQWFDTAQQLDIVINEFTPRPFSPNDAFVELHNVSDRHIDINGWIIGRSSTSRTISHSRAIAPGDFVVMQRNPPPDPQDGPVHFIEAPIFPLGMTTDRLFVRTPDGLLIDSISYNTPFSSSWIPGSSVEKKSPTYAGMDPTNWTQHPESNSIGEENHAQPLDLLTQLSLAAYFEKDTVYVLTNRFIRWDQNAEFRIGSVSSTLPHWNPFTSNAFSLPVPSSVTLYDRPIIINLENMLDYSEQELGTLTHEIAQPPRPGDLLLNEILYQPLQDRFASHSDQSEFIEIRNTASWRITLKDVLIRDPIDKNGQFASIKPENALFWTVDGNGFALIVPDTVKNIQNSRTARFFGLEPDVSWGHVNRSGLSLSTSGKPLILSLNDGTSLDSVYYTPEMHNPLLREQKGISLERVTSSLVNVKPHWTSSADPLGATPGFLNSISVADPEHEELSGFQFHPNPFSPNHDGKDDVVEIRLFSKSIDVFSRITIFNIRGQRIRTLLNDGLTGRISSIIWDGTDDRGILSPTGVYIVLAESYDPESKRTKKHKKPLVLVRSR